MHKPMDSYPKQSMGLVYLPTFTIKISQMWVNTPYMDDMGMGSVLLLFED